MGNLQSHDLDRNGNPVLLIWGMPRRVFAGVMSAILLLLACYACVADSLRVAPVGAPTISAVTPPPPLAPPTLTPSAGDTLTLAPEATSVLVVGDCPPGQSLPPDAVPGWLGRSADCPDILFALVGGEQAWVQRPLNFPDDLYRQLPELRP
jgi:hypothetical protein